MKRLAAMLLLLATAACGSGGSAHTAGSMKVVAAEGFWGNIVGQLGESQVRVTSIITDPNADPHLYESTPRDAAAVADARLVVENGAGYDDFMSKLAGASSKKVFKVADAVDARGADVNPHLWYDLVNVRIVAQAIVDKLETLDPAHKDMYDANYRSFYDRLRPALAIIDTIKKKYAHAPVAYTERVAEYLLDDAGLDVVTPHGFAQSVEDGTEPSAADQHAMNELIDRRAIKMLIYNKQTESRVTEAVRARAQRAGIPVVAVTETMPKNEPDYQSWQLHQLQAMLAALGG